MFINNRKKLPEQKLSHVIQSHSVDNDDEDDTCILSEERTDKEKAEVEDKESTLQQQQRKEQDPERLEGRNSSEEGRSEQHVNNNSKLETQEANAKRVAPPSSLSSRVILPEKQKYMHREYDHTHYTSEMPSAHEYNMQSVNPYESNAFDSSKEVSSYEQNMQDVNDWEEEEYTNENLMYERDQTHLSNTSHYVRQSDVYSQGNGEKVIPDVESGWFTDTIKGSGPKVARYIQYSIGKVYMCGLLYTALLCSWTFLALYLHFDFATQTALYVNSSAAQCIISMCMWRIVFPSATTHVGLRSYIYMVVATMCFLATHVVTMGIAKSTYLVTSSGVASIYCFWELRRFIPKTLVYGVILPIVLCTIVFCFSAQVMSLYYTTGNIAEVTMASLVYLLCGITTSFALYNLENRKNNASANFSKMTTLHSGLELCAFSVLFVISVFVYHARWATIVLFFIDIRFFGVMTLHIMSGFAGNVLLSHNRKDLVVYSRIMQICLYLFFILPLHFSTAVFCSLVTLFLATSCIVLSVLTQYYCIVYI